MADTLAAAREHLRGAMGDIIDFPGATSGAGESTEERDDSQVIYISAPQADLVKALEGYLEMARTGVLLSFVGVGLEGQDDDLLVALHGQWHIEKHNHVGALAMLQQFLLGHAVEEAFPDEPQRA